MAVVKRSASPAHAASPANAASLRHLVMGLEADPAALRELVEVDEGPFGVLVHGELHLAVGLRRRAHGEEREAFLDLPLVRARDARRRVNEAAGAYLELLALDVPHGGVPRQHEVERLDRMPVESFDGAGL